MAQLLTIIGVAFVLSLVGWRALRKEIGHAAARLDLVDRRVVETRFGAVEFAEIGSGPPILVSHGIFHGADGGLRAVERTVTGRRVICPSRFGYLGSALPPDASPADQARAFTEVLGHLGIARIDVMGISAGTGAALEMARLYPDLVNRLVISSGNFPGSPTATAPPSWARAFYSDAAMWALRKLARPMFGRLMGIPPGFPRDADQRVLVEELIDSIFPIRARRIGAIFDAWTSNPAIVDVPLEEVTVPTLVIHAADDPLASFEAAAAAVDSMPHAELVRLESGGHLQLGQTQLVRSRLESFLATPVISV